MNYLTTHKGLVTIRQAVPDDAAAVRELRLEALADYAAAFAADYETSAAEAPEVWGERIAKYTSDDSGVICIAQAEKQFVGMMGLACGHRPKTRHGGTLWGVYVKADWRGSGVAEALVEECVAWAQAHGVSVIKLGVITSNTAAIRCYARCGFSVYGIDPKVIYYDGVFHDELLMARSI